MKGMWRAHLKCAYVPCRSTGVRLLVLTLAQYFCCSALPRPTWVQPVRKCAARPRSFLCDVISMMHARTRRQPAHATTPMEAHAPPHTCFCAHGMRHASPFGAPRMQGTLNFGKQKTQHACLM